MRTLIAAAVMLIGLVWTAPARAEGWDSKGWVKLGERTVNGHLDNDRIEVGKYEGKFSKLTMYVENSELDLLDFEVTFGNGERFHPEVRYTFKEGTRTRVSDLPGDERVIKSINLKYKNTRGGGDAKVEIWGWKTVGAGEHHGMKPFTWARTAGSCSASGSSSATAARTSTASWSAATRASSRSSRSSCSTAPSRSSTSRSSSARARRGTPRSSSSSRRISARA